jgi:hypothetical protein
MAGDMCVVCASPIEAVVEQINLTLTARLSIEHPDLRQRTVVLPCHLACGETYIAAWRKAYTPTRSPRKAGYLCAQCQEPIPVETMYNLTLEAVWSAPFALSTPLLTATLHLHSDGCIYDYMAAWDATIAGKGVTRV